jgi:dihydroorotate dehydrogenase (fumarate)
MKQADLATRYLGLDLANPLVAASSPLTGRLASLRELERAGVAAVVLPSLFQEQIEHDELAIHELHQHGAESFHEATSYLPELDDYRTGPETYLDLVEAAKKELAIPVIASLNGTTRGGWVHHARRIQDAGADALELNIYYLFTDPEVTGGEVEHLYLELVADVRAEISIPLAVKLGPFFSSPAWMAKRLVEAGSDGLVLFNRLVQPDIDLDSLEMVPDVVLSRSWESRLALRWIAILEGRVDAGLAATGGVHRAEDLVKLLLVGADVVTVASSLLEQGSAHATTLLEGLSRWLRDHEYGSVAQLRGSMSQRHCPDPSALERSNYMRVLQSYSGRAI